MGGEIFAQLFEEKIIIQAKHQQETFGIEVIQEVFTTKAYYNATRALVIITSHFTGPALKLADNLRVECWDWDRLLTELRKNHIYYPIE